MLMVRLPSGTSLLLGLCVCKSEQQQCVGEFLSAALEPLPQLNEQDTVILTDRGNAICAAVGDVLPAATHLFCIVHICRNIADNASKLGLNKERLKTAQRLAFVAATAPSEAKAAKAMTVLRTGFPAVHRYLRKIPPNRWMVSELPPGVNPLSGPNTSALGE